MSKKWTILGGGAALAAIIVFSTITWMKHYVDPLPSNGVSYLTDVGEQRTVTLTDGTTVDLNSDTWMYVAFDSHTRKISLSRGEAYFTVKEEGRPLHIAAGPGVVTAPGSTFATAINGSEMVVSVAEGRVAVYPKNDASQRRILTALQKTAVSENRLGNIEKLTRIEPDWLDGWLEFENEALDHVVAEMDKYYRGGIKLEGVPQLRVSGRYRIADIDTAIRILAKSMQLEMSISDTGDITFFPREE